MIFIVLAPFYDLALRLDKRIIHVILSRYPLNKWKVIRTIATGSKKILIYKSPAIFSFHKKAHSFLFSIATNELIIRMILADNCRNRPWCKAANTCD